MITLVDVRDEAVARIKAAFAGNKKLHVAAHPGQFNEAEIKRLANQTPAILTSFMRYADEEHAAEFVSWVLCRADAKDRLYDGALKIVSALIPVIANMDAEWCIDGGERIKAECLYSGTLDQINATLWAVRWEWRIQGSALIGEDIGELDWFEGYDATHAVGNETAKDNINLEV